MEIVFCGGAYDIAAMMLRKVNILARSIPILQAHMSPTQHFAHQSQKTLAITQGPHFVRQASVMPSLRSPCKDTTG